MATPETMGTAGRAWVFGAAVSTDDLAPSAFLKYSTEEMMPHCMASLDPAFARDVRPGDIFVAGPNLGVGSSREQAAECLKRFGIAYVIAPSVARIFYRNCFNLGLPVLICSRAGEVSPDDVLTVDPTAGRISNLSKDHVYMCDPIPGHLLKLVEDGGLMAHLEKRFRAQG